jgi:c(7)-type cytochrome triheme protein
MNMRNLLAGCLVFSMAGLTVLLAQTKTPPAKLVLRAKSGNITFDHAAHAKREKNDCKVCHPAPFAQDAKAPLAFKPPHKNAEDKKASCGACHRAGGTAFETKANCTNGKCHTRAAAKKE